MGVPESIHFRRRSTVRILTGARGVLRTHVRNIIKRTRRGSLVA